MLSASPYAIVHCCADDPPVDLFVRAGAAALSLDGTRLGRKLDEQVATALDAGVDLLLGLVPTAADVPDVAAAVAQGLQLWSRWGFASAGLSEVGVTPTCGLAGLSMEQARASLTACSQVAARLADAA